LSLEYKIPPGEIGRRFTAKDVAQLAALRRIHTDEDKRAQRQAELEQKARTMREGVR